MKAFSLIVALFVGLLVILHTQDGVVHGAELSCKATVAELMKKQLGGISACTKSLKFKNGKEKAKKMTCVMKCVMKKEALLDEAGQLNDKQFVLFLDKHFGPHLHEQVTKTFATCIASASKGMDDKEEYCKDYDSLLKCMMGVLPALCG